MRLRLEYELGEQRKDDRETGAYWVIRKLRERAETKPLDSPERLELYRALNAIQGQIGALRREEMP